MPEFFVVHKTVTRREPKDDDQGIVKIFYKKSWLNVYGYRIISVINTRAE